MTRTFGRFTSVFDVRPRRDFPNTSRSLLPPGASSLSRYDATGHPGVETTCRYRLRVTRRRSATTVSPFGRMVGLLSELPALTSRTSNTSEAGIVRRMD